MATIGLSKPYIAKYIYDPTTDAVGYTDGQLLAKAVEFSADIEGSSDNNLYADNGIAETDTSFSGGTVSVTTDDLMQEASAVILGVKPSVITVGDKEVTELIHDDDANPPELGFGIVIKKKKEGLYKWRAVVFTKIKFNIPAEAATTQGETIEWQTPAIEATVMRADNAKHSWKREATLDTEAEAVAYIKTVLNISDDDTPEA